MKPDRQDRRSTLQHGDIAIPLKTKPRNRLRPRRAKWFGRIVGGDLPRPVSPPRHKPPLLAKASRSEANGLPRRQSVSGSRPSVQLETSQRRQSKWRSFCETIVKWAKKANDKLNELYVKQSLYQEEVQRGLQHNATENRPRVFYTPRYAGRDDFAEPMEPVLPRWLFTKERKPPRLQQRTRITKLNPRTGREKHHRLSYPRHVYDLRDNRSIPTTIGEKSSEGLQDTPTPDTKHFRDRDLDSVAEERNWKYYKKRQPRCHHGISTKAPAKNSAKRVEWTSEGGMLNPNNPRQPLPLLSRERPPRVRLNSWDPGEGPSKRNSRVEGQGGRIRPLLLKVNQDGSVVKLHVNRHCPGNSRASSKMLIVEELSASSMGGQESLRT